MRLEWAAQASRDIDEIWIYVAADDPDAADRLVTRIHSVVLTLLEQPRLGRQSRLRGTRQFAIAGTPYLVIYQPMSGELKVLRVLHGARRR